jgi:hypothetical protein
MSLKQRRYQESDLRKVHRSVAMFAWAQVATVFVFAGVIAVMMLRDPLFTGFSPEAGDRARDIFFMITLFSFVGIRMTKRSILKKDKSDTFEQLADKLRSSAIVALALGEIPAVLGLFLFFVGGYRKDCYLLLGFGLLLMVLFFPKYDNWGDWLAGRRGSA